MKRKGTVAKALIIMTLITSIPWPNVPLKAKASIPNATPSNATSSNAMPADEIFENDYKSDNKGDELISDNTLYNSKSPDSSQSAGTSEIADPNQPSSANILYAGKSNDITWSIDGDGKLLVEGSGDYELMSTYLGILPPWGEYGLRIHTAEINVTGITNASKMFSGCANLKNLDISNFDTSHVTDMEEMFNECLSLVELNLSNFDTSKVTNMKDMFHNCSGLAELDLSNFDTSHVTNMESMFFGCSMTELDLSNFDMSNVTDVHEMFRGCKNLKDINLSSFGRNNIINMNGMFSDCHDLTKLDLSNFDTSHVTDMNSMFSSCLKLSNLDLSNFNTANVTKMGSMFYNCHGENFTNLDLSSFDTSKVTDMDLMFGSCNNLTNINLSSFDTSNLTDMLGMFEFCESLTNLDLSNFNLSAAKDVRNLLTGCDDLLTIYTPKNLSLSNASLPKASDDSDENKWYMPDGTEITVLPANLAYSIKLIRGSIEKGGGLQWSDSILDSLAGQEGIKCTVGDIYKGSCFITDTNKETIKTEDSGLVWTSSDNDLFHYCGSYFDKESGIYYGYFKVLKPGAAMISVKDSDGETITRKIKCNLNISLEINDRDINKNIYGYQNGKFNFEKEVIKATISNESPVILSNLLLKNQQEKDIYGYANSISVDKESSTYHVDSMKFIFDSNNVPLSFDKDVFLQEIAWIDSKGIIEYGGELATAIPIYPNKEYTVRNDIRGINFNVTCSVKSNGKADLTQKIPLRFINYDVPVNTNVPTGSPIHSDATKDALKKVVTKASEQDLIKIPLGSLFTEEQSNQLNIILSEWIDIATNPDTDSQVKKKLFSSYSEDADKIESSIIIPVNIDNLQYPRKGKRRIKFSLEFRDIGKGLNTSLHNVWKDMHLSASTNLLEWELLDRDGINLGAYSGTLDFITYADLASLHELMNDAEKKAKDDFKKAVDKDLKLYKSELEQLYESILAESNIKILPYASDVFKNWFITCIWGDEFDESDFIESIKGTLKKQISKKITVKCPVDVYLYYNSELVGVVENNTINPVYDTHYIGSYVSVNGDTKTIYLPDEDFSIKLIGNDAGTMDYIVEEYEKDANKEAELIRTVYFDNLPLKKGKIYTGILENGIRKDKSKYALHTDGQTVEATYDTMLGDQIVDRPSADVGNDNQPDESKPGENESDVTKPDNNGNVSGPGSSSGGTSNSGSSSGNGIPVGDNGTSRGRRASSDSQSSIRETTIDRKKGPVNAVTGIITGEGPGYCIWQQDMTGWRLRYLDGTYATGTNITDSTGRVREQILWEQVNGAWYAFGLNSYAKEGFVYDYTLPGWFYIDINRGMLTDWQFINGKWYYFNPISDGSKGKMFSDAWIGQYYVNLSGAWEENR